MSSHICLDMQYLERPKRVTARGNVGHVELDAHEIMITFAFHFSLFTFHFPLCQTYGADFLNAVYFRRSLTCTLGITNDLIDSGQPRDKPIYVKRIGPQLATVYQVVG